jgi:hypothetical protein
VLIGTESLDLGLNELLDILRHRAFKHCKRTVEHPHLVHVDDSPLREEVVCRMAHEQEVTFGAPMNHSGEVLKRT